MVKKFIIFVVAALTTYLICLFVGGILITTHAEIAQYVGEFLKEFASLIAILTGLWCAFVGVPGLPVV